MRCPICEREFDPRNVTSLPFCSPRCQQIDLGRWLGESYAVPHIPPDDEEDDDSHFDSPSDDGSIEND